MSKKDVRKRKRSNTDEKTSIVMSKKDVRKRKRSNTNDNDVKRWSDLPNDLMDCIKKRLFYSGQSKFSAVCKSWSSIKEKEEDRILVPPLQQMPWLLVFDKPDSCTLVDPNYKAYTVDMKSIKEKMNISSFDKIQCHESKYGWLLMSIQSSYSTSLFLYSPFLGENNNCIELPFLGFGICVAALTSNPLDDDWTVVTLNTAFETDAIIIHTYSRGHSCWNSQVFKCDQFSPKDVKRWMYTDEGIFYYVISDGRVGTFDLAREEWKVFPPLPMEATLRKLFSDPKDVKVYMMKSGEELFLISERNLSRETLVGSRWDCGLQHIYKLDLTSMIWEDLKSVGERVLFIGDGYRSILNSSVLKSNGERTKITDTIYYCSLSQLFYSTVHDYTATFFTYHPSPRRCYCDKHYGRSCLNRFTKMLIDPPSLHH